MFTYDPKRNVWTRRLGEALATIHPPEPGSHRFRWTYHHPAWGEVFATSKSLAKAMKKSRKLHKFVTKGTA